MIQHGCRFIGTVKKSVYAHVKCKHDADQVLLPVLLPNLATPAQPLRHMTHRLLALLDAGTGDASPGLFERWALIESPNYSVESGRTAAQAITRMQASLEYGRVPEGEVQPLVAALLGALHIRYMSSDVFAITVKINFPPVAFGYHCV